MNYPAFVTARRIAFFLPLALLAGAWGSQLWGGLYPCEMCHWQRWPHYAALVLAGIAFVIPGRTGPRTLVTLAAFAIAISGAIGVYHAGIEYHWWQGATTCTSTVSMTGTSAQDRLKAIMDAPLIRCDTAQWTLLGVSLAGFNALFSLAGALAIFSLMRRAR